MTNRKIAIKNAISEFKENLKKQDQTIELFAYSIIDEIIKEIPNARQEGDQYIVSYPLYDKFSTDSNKIFDKLINIKISEFPDESWNFKYYDQHSREFDGVLRFVFLVD